MLELLTKLVLLLSMLSASIKSLPQLGAIETETKIEINNKFYTQAEYESKKQALIIRVKETKIRGSNFDTYNDYLDWIAILNRDCKGKTFDKFDIEKINEKLKSC